MAFETEQCIGMPQHLCIYCTVYVKRFSKFRQKCQLAYFILKKILDKNKQIKSSHLQALNTNVLGLKPTLSFMDLKNCHEEEIQFQQDKIVGPDSPQRIKAPIAHSCKHENVIIPTPSQNNFNNDECALETSTWRCIEEKSNSPKNIDSFNVTNENVSETDSSTDNCLQNADEVISIDSDDELLNEENEEVACVEMREESDETREETNEVEAENFKSIKNAKGNGCDLEPEYAKMIPLSMLEMKAVSEVYKLCGKGKHRCETCKKCYNTQKGLDIHLRMHDMIYTNLMIHMRSHTKEKPFACPLCDRTFSMQSNRNRHLLVHTGEKPYECEICSRRFSQKGVLT